MDKTALDTSHKGNHLEEMYQDWFLDYASYVILERAVPTIEDGFKPVQRRIMHALNEIDDGRFHKVANVIGQTMQYHPHGDAAIGDAMVNLGQKELLLDTQGNWGDYRTGDGAAAPRYIEVRLSKFGKEVVFSPKVTDWQLSYDGRKNEPVNLPVKFPLLLAQGVEGIAVGLSTKILPHNFNELIDASIAVLKGKKTRIEPDFPGGGQADFSNYNRGARGGRVRCRAVMEAVDKKTLLIKEIPYGTTTSSLIDSILKANDRGKIKIRKVVDNTARDVEIQIDLPSGVSPDLTIDALYAFTDCEVSIAPNACVIIDEKPVFAEVDEILRISTENTRELLRRELEIRKAELQEKWHMSSLEKIFIENRIYRDIEECESWEEVIAAIDKGLDPFKKQLLRAVTEEDIVRLTEIRIKRISKYDSFKADEAIRKLEEAIAETEHYLANLTEYAIDFFKALKEKYGKGRERRTEIRNFETIEVQAVAANNSKLYINRKDGFIGSGLKKDEFIADCSDIDDVIVFRKDGRMLVTRMDDKKFVGKDIIHAGIWKKGDERTIYHMVYLDGGKKVNYVKRFAVTSITRDKEYDLTRGSAGSKLIYFSVHPNSEEETISVQLHPGSRARNKVFEFDFGSIAIKGRGASGNIISRYPIRKIEQKAIGESTLGGVDIWLDETVGRLNKDERGRLLGNFNTGDQILVVFKNGSYELTNFELTNRYDMTTVHEIRKFDPEAVASVVYYDGSAKQHYVKRFKFEQTAEGKNYSFVSEHKSTRMDVFSLNPDPQLHFKVQKGKDKQTIEESVKLAEFIEVKGWKAMGNQLSRQTVKGKLKLEEPAETEAVETKKPSDSDEKPGENGQSGLKPGDTIEFDF